MDRFFIYKNFLEKGENGPMCAASNRSRERENKNENRDVISTLLISQLDTLNVANL